MASASRSKNSFCDIESCIINKGWMSNCFKIEKGVRQGCPLYPYLFVLFVEGLANTIRRDPSNKGISISQNELKLRQHADNNTLILHSSQDTLEASFDIIEKLKKRRRVMVSSCDFSHLHFITDASLTGSGAICLGKCFHFQFSPDILTSASHILSLELYTMVLAVRFGASKLRH